jgi:hypothetical protein
MKTWRRQIIQTFCEVLETKAKLLFYFLEVNINFFTLHLYLGRNINDVWKRPEILLE